MFIGVKAPWLIGKYGFTESDGEDIEQDLTLPLLTGLAEEDASKSRLATCVRVVVDRRVVSIFRDRTPLGRGI